MAILNWGDLTKNQEDSETIEQAIERIIAQHNANEESHLDTGQSLQSHKASDIIDHLAESIVQDKIADGQITLDKLTAENQLIISALESLDCWLNNITGPSEIGSLIMQTGSGGVYQKYMHSTKSGGSGLDWSKDFFYQSAIHITYDSDQIVQFGVGGTEYSEGTSGAGFKIVNGTLYAGTMEGEPGDYAFDWEEIIGLTLIGTHVFRIKYDSKAGVLYFTIDNVLVRTISTGLPTTNADEFAHYEIKNTASTNRYIVIYDLIHQRPR